MSKDLGDFQTPLPLVREILHLLTRNNEQWTRVLEPTCGQGNFIRGLLEYGIASEIHGIEIQQVYIEQARQLTQQQASTHVTVQQANIFAVDLQTGVTWKHQGPLLVLGNPPWMTSATLGKLESSNLPTKSNFKRFSGLGAMTGESNFDIAEYTWLKLIWELAPQQPAIAMLCKTSVARNVLRFVWDKNIGLTEANIWKIDSKKHFGVDVDACLFHIRLHQEGHCLQAHVFSHLSAAEPISTLSMRNSYLVSDSSTSHDVSFVEGTSSLVWRQGLKHDAASVFELRYDANEHLHNKLGERVEIEQEYVYPLLKGSDLGGKIRERPRKAVIVTQQRIGEDTYYLANAAPMLWQYLIRHREMCDARKSSIYNGKPPFSMFGIGDYSFAPYKVAISGLHKTPKFVAIGNVDGHAIQFDDTCYFVACTSAQQAALIACLLNHPLCLQFINSIAFWDAKRPITKKLLQRIDVRALFHHIDKQALLKQATVIAEQLTQGKKTGNWPDNVESLIPILPEQTASPRSPSRHPAYASAQST